MNIIKRATCSALEHFAGAAHLSEDCVSLHDSVVEKTLTNHLVYYFCHTRHLKLKSSAYILVAASLRSSVRSKMNNLLRCICCCTGFNALIYTACVIVQWILFASEKSDEVACLNDVALAAAILSSLATLGKYISASYSAYLAVNNTRTSESVIISYILKFLQLLLKLAATGCTSYLTASRINDSCGTKAYPGYHQELPPLIIAVASLEAISSSIESVIKFCDVCYKCQQRKKMKRAGEYEPLNNNGEQQ